MTQKWPEFITADLGNSDVDTVELWRRWNEYDRAMKDLISKGGVHQDDDGWWVETATGEMIGPDPDIERPLEAEEHNMKPLREVLPDLAKSIDREIARRGRPKAQAHKKPVTIRLDPEVVEHYKAMGKGWQTRMNNDLRKISGLH